MAAIVFVILAGCASSATYEPDRTLVPKLGLIEATRTLQTILDRTLAPVISNTHFVDGAQLAFRCERSSVEERTTSSSDRKTRVMQCPEIDMHIVLTDIDRIEIVRPDFYVILRQSSHRLFMGKPRTHDDAMQLVDLLAGLRDAIAREAGIAVAPLEIAYTRVEESLE